MPLWDRDWSIRGPYQYWWRDIVPLIPEGTGLCVDVGCGAGEQKSIIEQKGYNWLGIDVQDRAPASLGVRPITDGVFPVADSSANCLLCRQILEHVEDLDGFAAECYRILEPAGFIYGSHSWLEPDHDNASFFNLSHDGIRRILSKHSFELVVVEPGIHVGVLLLYRLFNSGVASKCARLVRLVQERSDRIRLSQKRPEDAGLTLERLQRENALRFAGHLLWIARKS